jgi:hypothetical protein
MLGCVTVFGLLLGGIYGCGLGLGFLLHWLVPAIDRGMATLCGLVATGIALLAFGQLMTLAEPSAAGSDIHVMLALHRGSRQVIVTDEEFDSTDMMVELLGKGQRVAHQP